MLGDADPFADLEEVMSEPPHGHNHGRARGHDGGWRTLESESDTSGFPSYKRYIEGPRKHGTRYVAQKLRCKCDKCRLWRREHTRRHRAGGL